MFNYVDAGLTTTTSDTILTTLMEDIGTTLASGLTIVLGLIAVLVGLFFILRFVWRKIGRSKG